MRGLVFEGVRVVTGREVPDPIATDGEVVVDVVAAGVCGSELEAYTGRAAKRVPPLVLGHEASVRIPGHPELYVLNPLISCGHCASCRAGAPNLCANRQLLSIERDGAFAERVVVPRTALVPVPTGVDGVLAALAEPAATALHALDVPGTVRDRSVLVIGCGSLGLMAVALARALGAGSIAACDILSSRRELAVAFGAQAMAAPADGETYDVVLDMVGSEATRRLAVEHCGSGGYVRLVGLHSGDTMVSASSVISRGLKIEGIYAYSRAQIEQVLDLMATRAIDLRPLIHEMPLDEGAEAFRVLAEHPDRWVKVVLIP